MNCAFIQVIYHNVTIEKPDCKMVRIIWIKLYTSHWRKSFDIEMLFKLSIFTIEWLNLANWPSSSNCKIPFFIPIYIKTNSVHVNLIMPEKFVSSCINKFNLSSRCGNNTILCEIDFIRSRFDRAPYEGLYDPISSFSQSILVNRMQLEFAQVPDSQCTIESYTAHQIDI